jgi:GTP-binding protein YchF
MELALVGLSSSGRTALFEALTGVAGTSTGHALHRGILSVPDDRVERLAPLFSSRKSTHATISLVDTPGLAPAGQPAAQHNDQILGEIREPEALVYVVRVFRSESVPHPSGDVHPTRDLQALLADLRLSDLGIIEKRLQKLELTIAKEPKAQRDTHLLEQGLLQQIVRKVEAEEPVDISGAGEAALQTIKGYGFFALKPGLVVANVGDLTDTGEKETLEELQRFAGGLNMPVVAVNAALEVELREFPPEERGEYYEAMGLPGPALAGLIEAVYGSFNLISFLTANENECRAWPLRAGATAPEAAGVVHTDMQHGFIRAEVVSFNDLMEAGSVAEAKKHGIARLEGKDYVVQDGDVIFFHFSR